MATATGYSPIAGTQDASTALLTQLLGSRQNTQQNTLGQTAAVQNGNQVGSNVGSTAGTTTSTANLDPLMQSFSQNIGGMDVDTLKALIQGIFTEGAQAVPALTAQYANSTGSRVSGNSGLQLALGDLNKNLSTQAVQALLTNNNQQQATASNAASQIAANTRQTAQTGTTQAATQQQNTQQTGQTAQTAQNSTVKTGVNPSQASLLGLGGTALNFLDKKGLFDKFFGTKTPATPASGGGVGTIAGGNSNVAAPVLTNGGGAAAPTAGGQFYNPAGSAPATSLGAYKVPDQPVLPAPAPAAPAGGGFMQPQSSFGGDVPSVAPPMPAMDFSGGQGISQFLGSGSSPGLGGFGGGLSFGGVGSDASNVFGTASTGALGDNLSFGSNPFGYAGSGSGITGAVGMSTPDAGGFGSMLSGAGDWLSSVGGGISDWLGSLFANGGNVGGPPMYQPPGYNDRGYGQGGIPSRLNFADGGMPCYPSPSMPGTNMNPNISGSWLNPAMIGRSLMGPGGGYIDGAGYADGGGIGAVGDGRYGAPSGQPMRQVAAPTGNMFEVMRGRNEAAAGLRDPRAAQTAVPLATGVPGQDPAMTGQSVMQLIPFLVQQMLGFANGGQVNGNFTGSEGGATGSFFADGGQVADTQVDRRRNVNYMGARRRQDQSSAENYDGYSADPSVGVAASQPAGGSPSLSSPGVAPALLSANLASAPSAAFALTPEDAAFQQRSQVNAYNENIRQILAANEAQNQAAAGRAAISNPTGGSGGVGEGASTNANAQNSLDAQGGAIGISNSAISGIVAAISAMIGMQVPAAQALAIANALGITVSQANAPANNAAMQAVVDAAQNSGAEADEGSVGSVSASVSVGDSEGDAGTTGGNAPGASGTTSDGSGYASGGLIKGPGTGTSDSIPATLDGGSKPGIHVSTDEFIMPADVVAMFGPQHFQRYIDTFHTPA